MEENCKTLDELTKKIFPNPKCMDDYNNRSIAFQEGEKLAEKSLKKIK